MRQVLVVLAFVSLCAPLSAVERLNVGEGVPRPAATAQSVRLQSSVVSPGGMVRLLSSGGRELSVELRAADGSLIGRGAPVNMRAGSMATVTAFLMPLDTTISPGLYQVVAEEDSGKIHRFPVTVAGREFPSQEITLDRRLTVLRSVPDPEKTRQTQKLSELIFSRDPTAVYHTGPLIWPLPRGTRETSQFGVRRRFVYHDGSDARTIHVGLDLAAPTGTDVVSSGNGVVRMAEYRIVTGGTVVIEHLPGVYSLYYHLHSVEVQPGELLAAGSVIGSVGATGLATGAHLHWEVRVAGIAVDPVALTEQPLFWRG